MTDRHLSGWMHKDKETRVSFTCRFCGKRVSVYSGFRFALRQLRVPHRGQDGVRELFRDPTTVPAGWSTHSRLAKIFGPAWRNSSEAAVCL